MTLIQATETLGQDYDSPVPRHWRQLGWTVGITPASGIALIDADQWQQLSRRALEENPYFSRQYVLAGLETIDRAVDLRAFTVSDNTGRLVGFFPFRRGWGAIHCARNPYQFTGTPLVDRSRASTALAAWLECMQQPLMTAPIVLRDVPLDGELASRIRTVAAASGLTTAETSQYQRPKLTRRYSSFQAHCDAVISARRRRELERSIRRMRELGVVRFERIGTPNAVRHHLEQFLSLEQAGWKGRAGTAFASSPESAAFARKAFGGQAGREGLANLDVLFLDDRAVAFSVNVASGRTLFTPKGTYDETLRQFGPGLILEYFVMRHFYEGGGGDFDAMDSSTTVDGHVIQGFWSETVRMGTLIIGRPSAVAAAARLEACRNEVRAMARSLRAGITNAITGRRQRRVGASTHRHSKRDAGK